MVPYDDWCSLQDVFHLTLIVPIIGPGSTLSLAMIKQLLKMNVSSLIHMVKRIFNADREIPVLSVYLRFTFY